MKLPKEKLDEAITLLREWNEQLMGDGYNQDESLARLQRAHKALDELNPRYEFNPYALQDIILGAIRMKQDATNEDICKMLEVLGWTVE